MGFVGFLPAGPDKGLSLAQEFGSPEILQVDSLKDFNPELYEANL